MYVPGLWDSLSLVMKNVCWQLEATEVASFLLQFVLFVISVRLRGVMKFCD